MKYFFFQRPALVFSLAGLTVLTCLEVPVFISCFCLILWAWKWLAEQKILAVMPRRMTTFLSIFLFAYIFFQYRTLFAQEASSGLLVGLTALKVMDYSNRRDHLLVVLLGFLLLTLKPLYGLDLYWLPVQLICMISLWWALSQDTKKLPRSVISKIFIASLPISLLLFLVFPRIVLPWAMSQTHRTAKMGFSTDLNPGEVSKLATSNDLVLRVRFDDDSEINPKDLYWKGGVLTVSKGLAWQAEKTLKRVKKEVFETEIESLKYEIILEPGQGNLVFAMDPTYSLVSPGNPLAQYEGRIWRVASASGQARRFYGKSSLVYKNEEQPSQKDLTIQALPPASAKWVADTKAKTKNFPERRAALQKLFSHPEFVYTLNPGPYGKNPMDEFLFQKRRGFCEHFAGAYATLARALGIPSRVISGYQGAEYNSLGDFWRVTQKQAHAWVEIWNGSQWIRQDPTTWVQNYEFSRYSTKSIFSWIDESFDTYEALNYRWTTFLLDFDKNSQSLVLREWLPKIFLGLTLILAAFFFVRILRSWIFTSKTKVKQVRQHQLAVLIRQVKEAEEEYLNQELSHIPPLEIIKSAEKHFGNSDYFYSRLGQLYERAFYRENISDDELRSELKALEKKWVDIQILQK